MFNRLIFVLILILVFSCNQENVPKYKNPDLPIEARVDDLLSRMTTEEKFWQLFMIPGDLSDGKERYKHGIFGFQVATKGKTGNEAEQLLDYSGGGTATETAVLINGIQKYFVEETRLGIPIIPFDEALHGLVREGATIYPQAIGLAATWDTLMMQQVANAIALETKSRGIRQILSPVLNIARDVRWGRTEETYGEDPFLTSQMGVTFIQQFEQKGIITTPKHFIANVGDGGRDSYPIHFSERLFEEIYFPAFKAAFQKGKAQSVMTAYNSVDGRPNSANHWLLKKKLKSEWGFEGFVISDAGATGGANVLHFTAIDYADATRQAIENGQDVIFQTSYDHYSLFYEAFEKGMINEADINESVRRVLRAKFKLGLFENPYVDSEEVEKWKSQGSDRIVARLAANKSIVLLKNENETLPLKENLKSIAVIGEDAVAGRLGGYAGPGNHTVSILEGLKNKLGSSTAIHFVKGPGRRTDDFVVIPTSRLFCIENGKKRSGLLAEYFNNPKLEGAPVLTRVDPEIDFRWTLFSPDPQQINYDWYSARWTGKLVAPESGRYKIGISGDDGYRLYINGDLVLDNWKKQTVQTKTSTYDFIKDHTYDIKVEFFETVGNVWFKLIWDVGVADPYEKDIEAAVLAAKTAEAVILVAGIEEGEFNDRAHLGLPGHQEALIHAVAATGKPVVVLLVGGSAITMSNWIHEVPAILDVWYPGDEGGHAVADILMGDINPAGRLPITFPINEGQLPLYYNHKPTGRGDDYNDLSGKPLFPFGYGLSYTSFAYHDLSFDKNEIRNDERVDISFSITNTGNYDGDEVVQLYIKDLLASVARPIQELKGFSRIHIKKGETKKVSFTITPELLSMLDENMKRIVEPGDFRIMIGAASNDIRLRGILHVYDN